MFTFRGMKNRELHKEFREYLLDIGRNLKADLIQAEVDGMSHVRRSIAERNHDLVTLMDSFCNRVQEIHGMRPPAKPPIEFSVSVPGEETWEWLMNPICEWICKAMIVILSVVFLAVSLASISFIALIIVFLVAVHLWNLYDQGRETYLRARTAELKRIQNKYYRDDVPNFIKHVRDLLVEAS